MSQEQGLLIIFKSTDDCATWNPIKAVEVPEWVKDPDILGRMVDGEAAHDAERSPGEWFLAQRAKVAPTDADVKRMNDAEKKRIRRAQKRIRLLH